MSSEALSVSEGGDEQVHVIGHQHVGVHPAFEALGQF